MGNVYENSLRGILVLFISKDALTASKLSAYNPCLYVSETKCQWNWVKVRPTQYPFNISKTCSPRPLVTLTIFAIYHPNATFMQTKLWSSFSANLVDVTIWSPLFPVYMGSLPVYAGRHLNPYPFSSHFIDILNLIQFDQIAQRSAQCLREVSHMLP